MKLAAGEKSLGQAFWPTHLKRNDQYRCVLSSSIGGFGFEGSSAANCGGF